MIVCERLVPIVPTSGADQAAIDERDRQDPERFGFRPPHGSTWYFGMIVR
jgi:hypothetical protein